MGTNTSTAPDTRRILDALRRIVHDLRSSARKAEVETGISGAQLFVLQKLADEPAQSLNALAERAHTHQSSVSVVVSRLVARGLVERTRSTRDGRTIELSLSPDGGRLARRVPDLPQARLIAAIQVLAPARRRIVADALSDLSLALAGTSTVPAMFFEDRPAARAARPRRTPAAIPVGRGSRKKATRG